MLEVDGFVNPAPLRPQPSKLREVPEYLNKQVWEQFYLTRGATNARDRKRADYAVAEALRLCRVDDRSVVCLLNKLAAAAPRTDVSDRVMQITKSDASSTSKSIRNIMSQISEIVVDPRTYVDSASYFWDVQLVKLLSKYPFMDQEGEAVKKAVSTFQAVEARNRETNQRWQGITTSDPNYPLVERVEKLVGLILGKPPVVEEIVVKAEWGPGTMVDYAFKSSQTAPEFKWLAPLNVYPSMIPIARCFVELTSPKWLAGLQAAWGTHWCSVVEASELFTVAKSYETDRVCFKEASLAAFMQRGIGKLMLERFDTFTRRSLALQQDRNRLMAQLGSIDGSYCTVDLSSASDTGCRSMYRTILPAEWYSWCESVSASSYTLSTPVARILDVPDNVARRFELFTSMGNGFTFELESILFFSIVCAVIPGTWVIRNGKKQLSWDHVNVFGDDLIFPTAYYGKVTEALQFFGFIPNLKKSFATGHFRESCGGDFFKGNAVRPLYISRRLVDGQAIISLANRMHSTSFEIPAGHGCTHGMLDVRFKPMCDHLLSFIPKWVKRLISTPFSVPNGLWEVSGRVTTWETPEGQPPRWKVVGCLPVSVDLRNHSVWVVDGPSCWPLKANTWNVLLSRLGPRGDPMFGQDLVGMGDEVPLRDVSTYKVVISSIVEASRWGRFAPLAY